MMEPKPSEVWRHFKGSLYVVVGVSRSSEAWDDSSALVVVYFNLGPDGGSGHPILIHRPLSMWTAHIERDGYAGPRFVKEAEAGSHHAARSRGPSKEQ